MLAYEIKCDRFYLAFNVMLLTTETLDQPIYRPTDIIGPPILSADILIF